MLRITDITYSVAGRPLFVEASATIPTGHKVGLIGRNGAGKTTLFKLIRGELALENGSINMPARARIGNEVSLIDTVLAADIERADLLAEAETATDATRISDIQTRLTDIDAWSAEARAASILKGLGFTHAEQQQPCSAFSGGWRMRVALAAVLFSEPDYLLLDEPTNYLDLEGALWLEAYLVKYPHTVMIISHDRELLNRSVGAILHLDEKQLTYYTGNYDGFVKQRNAQRAIQAAAAKKQDLRRAHLQSFVDRFKAKANVVGIVGLVENMPSSNATRPGDVVKSMKGDTVEIINTDAEGRLVLCDIMWYAQERFKPSGMIDLATLTGAIIIGLGHDNAGVFSNDDALCNAFLKAASAEGEGAWRMPLGQAYDDLLKSRIADMKNVGGRAAGSVTAAQFLQRFVKDDTPWIHLDIAGVASVKAETTYAPTGATGWGVLALNRLVKDMFEAD